MKGAISIVFYVVLHCVSDSASRRTYYRQPTDPEFSDVKTDYDSPNGIQYYYDDDSPLLPNEWDVYRKEKPGGLLPRDEIGKQRATLAPLPRATLKTTSHTTTTRKASEWRRKPGTSVQHSNGRVLIDGSNPNTDLFEQLKNRRRVSGFTTVKPTLRDACGREIKPTTATNRFLIMGRVAGCRASRAEVYKHIFTETILPNSDPKVTGLTVEIPPGITFIISYQFITLPRSRQKMFKLQTPDNNQGYLKLTWYSC